jgi:vancomycin permeability regulator SanA
MTPPSADAKGVKDVAVIRQSPYFLGRASRFDPKQSADCFTP